MNRHAKIRYEDEEYAFSLVDVKSEEIELYFWAMIDDEPVNGKKIRSIEIVKIIENGETS